MKGEKPVWLGNTQVEVLNESTSIYESQTVNTKFILTVKDAADSLVTFEFMGGMPVVNLTTLTPNASDEVLFAATLEMEVQMPSYDSVTAICPYAAPVVGEYLPALDVFDCLQTNPAYVRPAITKFEYAFFYELSGLPALGLAEHDEHMEELVSDVQTTVNDIYTWTDFLYNDWVRISGLSAGQTEIKDGIAVLGGTLGEINAKVDSLLGQPGQPGQGDTVLDMLEEIDEGVSRIPDFLLLMFGLEDFIENEELRAFVPVIIASSPLYQAIDSRASQASMDSVEAKLDALQSAVETLQTSISDTSQIAVEAIEVRSQQRYLLSTVIGGLPVNVDLVSVLVVSVGQNKPITVTDVTGYATGTLVATGLLEVTLDLPKKMTDGDILRVTVIDANGYSGTVMVQGK